MLAQTSAGDLRIFQGGDGGPTRGSARDQDVGPPRPNSGWRCVAMLGGFPRGSRRSHRPPLRQTGPPGRWIQAHLAGPRWRGMSLDGEPAIPEHGPQLSINEPRPRMLGQKVEAPGQRGAGGPVCKISDLTSSMLLLAHASSALFIDGHQRSRASTSLPLPPRDDAAHDGVKPRLGIMCFSVPGLASRAVAGRRTASAACPVPDRSRALGRSAFAVKSLRNSAHRPPSVKHHVIGEVAHSQLRSDPHSAKTLSIIVGKKRRMVFRANSGATSRRCCVHRSPSLRKAVTEQGAESHSPFRVVEDVAAAERYRGCANQHRCGSRKHPQKRR